MGRSASLSSEHVSGFRPVGILRRYERDADGVGWHDGLLMDLLAEELDQRSDHLT
jgi:RimJ/RimL family protein N-acetyltransferase